MNVKFYTLLVACLGVLACGPKEEEPVAVTDTSGSVVGSVDTTDPALPVSGTTREELNERLIEFRGGTDIDLQATALNRRGTFAGVGQSVPFCASVTASDGSP